MKKFFLDRMRKQSITWAILPGVIVAGWIYPPMGFALLLCMIGAVGLSFFSGRSWCNWMCPRGSFFDLFFNKIGKSKPMPSWLRSPVIRYFMLALIFIVLGGQLYFAWGDIRGMGMAFTRLLTITTAVGIVMALRVHPRAWCQICPMGTLASIFGKNKLPLNISDAACTSCGQCAKNCPMGLTPNRDKETGQLLDGDCIKCGSCVAVCPVKALSFDQPTNCTINKSA